MSIYSGVYSTLEKLASAKLNLMVTAINNHNHDGTNGEAVSLTPITAGINALISAQIPSGVIVMWSGTIASIPSGWVICDGSNGTPDLRDRFIVGAKQDSGG